MKPKLIFIVGPTAVGKTDVALILAQTFDTEIVSCDAMQVYRELSLLTAKPSKDALKSIKHHLVDTVSVEKDCDVFSFRKKVLSAIAMIEGRKKMPIVVGGSGLYMAILLDGIFEEKDKDHGLAIRKGIEANIDALGIEAIYERLKTVDPVSAAKIHVHDRRRIVRALEVFETHGQPISELHAKRQGLWQTHDVLIFALTMEREKLYARINERVDRMFQGGVLGEVEQLEQKKISQTASGIIGLKETRKVLAGELSQEQAMELIKRDTRHYAKRQLTWFRKDKRLIWIDVGSGEDSAEVAQRILKITENQQAVPKNDQ